MTAMGWSRSATPEFTNGCRLCVRIIGRDWSMSVREHKASSHRKENWNVSGLSRELQAVWNAVVASRRSKADQAAVASASGRFRRAQVPFSVPSAPSAGGAVAFDAPFGTRKVAV